MKFIKRKNIDTYRPKSTRFSVEVDGRAIIDTNKTLTLPRGDSASRPGGIPGMIRYNTEIKDFEVFTDYDMGSWGWERLRTNRPSDIVIAQIGTGDGDGSIAGVNVVSGGTNYDPGTTILFDDPDVGTIVATGTVNVTPVTGVISSIDITDPGAGYLSVPQVTLQNIGSGQGAVLEVELTGTLEYAIPNNYIPLNSSGDLSETNIQVYVENVFQLPNINYTLIQQGSTAYVRFDAPVPFGKPVYVIYGFDR